MRFCCLPLRGGSGLKYTVTSAIPAPTHRLPLRGGSGLKFYKRFFISLLSPSPSARREWIEISMSMKPSSSAPVSLCEEGVD